MIDSAESESGAFSALEDMFNSLCGEQGYEESASDNTVVSFCGGACGGNSNNGNDKLQSRHTKIAGLDRNFFHSDFLDDDGKDPAPTLELTRILSADAHLLVLSDAVVQSLREINVRPGGSIGNGEDGHSLVSYASRCVKRTQARDIYSVSYCPTDTEKEEISNLPYEMSQFLKPWSVLLKRGVVDVHVGGEPATVGCSPKLTSKKSKVEFSPGKSCRPSHDTVTPNAIPAYIKDSTFKNADFILLNHVLMVLPPTPSIVDEMNEDQSSETETAELIPPMSFPLTKILAVMDLGICSGKSRKVKDDSTSTTRQGRKMTKHKSMFQKMKTVKMSKKVTLEKTPAMLSKNDEDPIYDDDSGSTSEDDSFDEDLDESSFCIVAANPSSGGTATVLTMHCSTPTHKILWLHALHRTLSGMPHLRKPFTFTNARICNEIGKQHSVMRTSIYSACILHDTKMLNHILQDGQKNRSNTSRQVIDVADSNGYSALHYAVMCHSKHSVRILLDAGANPNIKDSSGSTPVDYAASTHQSKILDMLLSKGGETKMDITPEREDSIGNMKPMMGEEMMQKRHKNIERMGEKSAGVHAKSVMYRDMAKQLKKKVKN